MIAHVAGIAIVSTGTVVPRVTDAELKNLTYTGTVLLLMKLIQYTLPAVDFTVCTLASKFSFLYSVYDPVCVLPKFSGASLSSIQICSLSVEE
jgi:hypothetical protein